MKEVERTSLSLTLANIRMHLGGDAVGVRVVLQSAADLHVHRPAAASELHLVR